MRNNVNNILRRINQIRKIFRHQMCSLKRQIWTQTGTVKMTTFKPDWNLKPEIGTSSTRKRDDTNSTHFSLDPLFVWVANLLHTLRSLSGENAVASCLQRVRAWHCQRAAFESQSVIAGARANADAGADWDEGATNCCGCYEEDEAAWNRCPNLASCRCTHCAWVRTEQEFCENFRHLKTEKCTLIMRAERQTILISKWCHVTCSSRIQLPAERLSMQITANVSQ